MYIYNIYINIIIYIYTHYKGVQIVIFEVRGPIHEKGTLKLFKEDTARGLASILLLGLLGSEVFALQKRILLFEKFIHNEITEAKRTPLQL